MKRGFCGGRQGRPPQNPPIPPPLSRWAGEGRGSGGGVRAQVPPSTTPGVALKKQNSIMNAFASFAFFAVSFCSELIHAF